MMHCGFRGYVVIETNHGHGHLGGYEPSFLGSVPPKSSVHKLINPNELMFVGIDEFVDRGIGHSDAD